MYFCYGLNCVVSLSLLATTTRAYHDSLHQLSNIGQNLMTFCVTVGWASVPVLNDAEQSGSGLEVSAEAPALFTERPSGLCPAAG